jgi:large subunit ribosomal protein L29
MSLPKFNEITKLSNNEIAENIIKTEKDLFNLKFKQATRQPFKAHEIKYAKRRIAQLKTILSLRLNVLEKNESSSLSNTIEK